MSFQVGSSCYAAASDAVAAAASSEVGAVVVRGSGAYMVDVASYTGSSITYVLRSLDGLADITTTLAVTPLPCGLLDWQDGLTLGWAVAGAWIATAVVLFLRKAVHE
jgi:hypothetical protein